jgi:hypothetical protein
MLLIGLAVVLAVSLVLAPFAAEAQFVRKGPLIGAAGKRVATADADETSLVPALLIR